MVEPPSDVDAVEGETVEFACRLTPCMPPPAVAWHFEPAAAHPSITRQPSTSRQTLDDGGDPRYRLSVTQDGVASLLIRDVCLSDSGIYTMSASSSAGTVEVTAVLTVHGQCMN